LVTVLGPPSAVGAVHSFAEKALAAYQE
jgi:hypothetical protein